MNQNDEFTKHDERFVHEDEYNRDYEMELHKKESFEGSDDSEDIIKQTLSKDFLIKKFKNMVKASAITVTVVASIFTVTTVHEHQVSASWNRVKDPTCISYGKEVKVCSDCGKTIDARLLQYSGHDQGEWVVTVASNCSHPGVEELMCTTCGESLKSRELPLGDHIEKSWQIEKEHTCIEDGYQVMYCAICNEEIKREVIPASHEIVIDKAVEPNCYQTGLSQGTHCMRCGAIIEKQEILPITHSAITIKGYAATCREDGLSDGKECSICKKVLSQQKVIPAAHTPRKVAGYPANCETWETGLTDGYVCAVCGYQITAQQEILPEHIQEVYIPDGWATTATCTEGVVGMGRCKVCGAETSTYIEIQDALGHNYVDRVVTDDTGMTNVWRECTRCGAIE